MNGRIVYRARTGHRACPTPPDAFWFRSKFDAGDQWQCDECHRVWTRFENYAGGGWS